MSTMFNTLLKLPLFQGLSQEDFTHILGKIKLHFIKYKPGETIVQADAQCKELIFLLNGEVYCETCSKNQLFTYTEILDTPSLIEPEAMFGMYPNFKASYIAKTDVSIMSIDKMLVLKELLRYNVFRLNYVNSISNRAQAIHGKLWNSPASGTRNKVIHFILNHAERLEGEKIIHIKMETLAEIVDDTRLNVSKVLNELQDEGFIQLKRKVIHIPEISKLTTISAVP